MFIELTRRTRDGKHKQQVRLDWIRNWRSDLSKGTQIEFTDGTDGFFDESPAAIRSALLKAGLLVAVEEGANEGKPPLEFPPASAVIDLSKTTIEGLCQAYAMWHGYPITDHPHDMRDAVIAELQRRIDAKPEQVVRLRMDKTNDGWFVSDGVVIVASRAHTKEAAKEIAKELVRRFAGPKVRIEWENET